MIRHLVIAGAQRSGTTWLYNLLDSHDNIIMAKPVRPEPKYFLKDHLEYVEYQKLFSIPDGFKGYLGEKSTSYIEFPAVAKKIINTCSNNDIKLIFVLRDPKLRAISNILFSQVNGYEDADISHAIEQNFIRLNDKPNDRYSEVSVSPNSYLERGLYYQQLLPFIDAVGRNNVYITLSEKIQNEESEVVQLFDFLDLSIPNHIDMSKKVNASNESSTELWQLLPEYQKKRIHEYYQSSNHDLSKYLNIDLSDYWQY